MLDTLRPAYGAELLAPELHRICLIFQRLVGFYYQRRITLLPKISRLYTEISRLSRTKECAIIMPMKVLNQTARLLLSRKVTLAVAESCTGGLVGHRLTNIAGSSTYYMGSITAYAYEAKVRLLGVRWNTLEQHGAVSKPVVIQMARGVRRALAADIGLSVSGIAGPGGGTPDKPVGFTCFGISIPDDDRAWEYTWAGNRTQNKEQSAEQALQLLVDYLRSLRDGND